MGILATFMGDAKSSNTTASTHNETTPTQTAGDGTLEQTQMLASGDHSVLAGKDGIAQAINITATGKTAPITVTDNGAVKMSFDFAEKSLKAIQDTTTQSLGNSSNAISAGFALAEKARSTESSENMQVVSKYMLVAGIAAIIGYTLVHIRS